MKTTKQQDSPANLADARDITPATEHGWKPNGHGRNSRKVGTLTLNVKKEFIQYGSNAADTDYVTCEPQTVDVMQHGDDYWLCAQFAGILTGTTRTYMVKIGEPAVAHLQTQSFGGVRDWLRSADTTLEITHPELEIATVGQYDDGSAMLAVRKKQPADPQLPESITHDGSIAVATPAHTPEPWRVVTGQRQPTYGTGIARGTDWRDIVTDSLPFSPSYVGEALSANAARIVACVNACAGMADPAKQIAKLREALETVAALGEDGVIERRKTGKPT